MRYVPALFLALLMVGTGIAVFIRTRDNPSPTIVKPEMSQPTITAAVPHTGPHSATPVTMQAVDWTQVVNDLGCTQSGAPDRGVQVDEIQFADVTGDSKPEVFVAVSCVPETTNRPSRLDVFDGASDPMRPHRIATLLGEATGPNGKGLLLGANRGSDPNPSITIDGPKVTVVSVGYAAQDTDCCPTLQIVDTFTWTATRFARGPRKTAEAAPGATGRAIVHEILAAMNAAKSYKVTLTTTTAQPNAPSVTVQNTIVAPDRSFASIEIGGTKHYEIVVAQQFYSSEDAQHWVAEQLPLDDPRVTSPTFFHLQITPRQLVDPLPDETLDGRTVGVVQLQDNETGERLVLRYDKQTHRLVQFESENIVDGFAQRLAARFADYDSPDNRVTKPETK